MGGTCRGAADAGRTAMTIPPRTTTTVTRGAAAMVRLTRPRTGTASGPAIARRTGMAGPARTGRLAGTADRTARAARTIAAPRPAMANKAATALKAATAGRADIPGQTVMATMAATSNPVTQSRGMSKPVTATRVTTAAGHAAGDATPVDQPPAR